MFEVSHEPCYLFADAAQVIRKSVQTVTAGENVTLNCRLAKEYNVVQVTWQKEHEKNEPNVATYSNVHGSRVLGKYQRNVHLSQSGLTVSAITFDPVTFKDEGCYSCVFNTFPLGSIPGKTCLKVYAFTEPTVHVKRVSDPDDAGEEVLDISCSATGRPAPVVTWKNTKHLLIKPNQYVIQHPNGTVTVVSNFTHVSSINVWDNPILCVIHHPSLNTAQELTLPEIEKEQDQNKNSATVTKTSSYILPAVFLLALVIFSISYYLWRRLPVDKKQDLLSWREKFPRSYDFGKETLNKKRYGLLFEDPK
ncbi:OX-2 membrane glycoprotein-like [Elgaria multicarinata webbii]|uniref:OX-2 membrane glycoprotein-like n=1 Tax=Elgaria multicarinata webbii TaxID=159646 RepID=UPI002FCD2735